VGSCEHSNETSGSTKSGTFPEELSDNSFSRTLTHGIT
jgi:hypothetical protein